MRTETEKDDDHDRRVHVADPTLNRTLRTDATDHRPKQPHEECATHAHDREQAWQDKTGRTDDAHDDLGMRKGNKGGGK